MTTAERELAEWLGFATGQTVREVGYGEDCDQALRAAVQGLTGEELLGEEADVPVDAVLLWWREEDGELTDALVDTSSAVGATGRVWLFTPSQGRYGYVEPREIGEAAFLAGLTGVGRMAVPHWTGTRLGSPPGRP
ncbi:DUF3052 domain-containing protein [Streptomyces sp. NPDC048514]|uniref:DUF3052 domain-containing protein n=1 Tax=Streptomyces sp. NPDC048514 TaxID=3365564 RepID=UPI0037160E12